MGNSVGVLQPPCCERAEWQSDNVVQATVEERDSNSKGYNSSKQQRALKLGMPMAVDIVPAQYCFSNPLESLQMSKCRETLTIIMSPAAQAQQDNFFNLFWSNLQIVDTDAEIVHRFEPSALSHLQVPDKNVILVRLLKFITCCPPQKFIARSRALGKSHYRIGVDEKQLRVFAESLMRTLAYSLGPRMSNTVMEHWVELIMFTIQQMTRGGETGSSRPGPGSGSQAQSQYQRGGSSQRLLLHTIRSDNNQQNQKHTQQQNRQQQAGGYRPLFRGIAVIREVDGEDEDDGVVVGAVNGFCRQLGPHHHRDDDEDGGSLTMGECNLYESPTIDESLTDATGLTPTASTTTMAMPARGPEKQKVDNVAEHFENLFSGNHGNAVSDTIGTPADL